MHKGTEIDFVLNDSLKALELIKQSLMKYN